jgi:hypothetical protein
MKNIFSFTILLSIAIFSFSMAQDTNDESQSDRPSRSFKTKVGGAGGVTPIVTMFDNTEIDNLLRSAHLPTLGSDPMYLIGGEGYGYIMFIKNVRFGGFGASGSRTVSAIDNLSDGTQLKKEVKYGVSYGGFLIDYVMPVAERIDVAVGGTIGGGSMNIRMTRDKGSFKDWGAIWNNFGTDSSTTQIYTRNLTGGFVVFNPHVSIEYTMLRWLQLRIGVGYPIFFSPDWKLDDQFSIDNVPSKMKANGYTINAGIMFGFFGW